jgi:hypothetical protein
VAPAGCRADTSAFEELLLLLLLLLLILAIILFAAGWAMYAAAASLAAGIIVTPSSTCRIGSDVMNTGWYASSAIWERAAGFGLNTSLQAGVSAQWCLLEKCNGLRLLGKKGVQRVDGQRV